MPKTTIYLSIPEVLIDDLGVGVTTGGVDILYNAEYPTGLIELRLLGPFIGSYKEKVKFVLDYLGLKREWRGQVLSIKESNKKSEIQTHTYTIKLLPIEYKPTLFGYSEKELDHPMELIL